MVQRANSIPAVSYYDEMPFSLVLFRYLWPFWLFKDASCGDRMTRAAAYRHNRSMRAYLPGYMLRWVFSSLLAFAFVCLADASAQGSSFHVLPWVVAAGAIAFVASLCVLLMTGYVYLYLDRNES
jgi:hypothetical protein